MAKNLVIVESPAKAKTIKKYLGADYEIEASLGHVRDLPVNSLGVDIENGFHPNYEILKGKQEVIRKLKKHAEASDRIYLATDPDREGEAISWHLATLLKINTNEKCRITFNEITEKAVKEAIAHPMVINSAMVNSQQARRILDRIVGYKISPLLWKKVKKGLSAGRVQSVAVKLICEREEEILRFVPSEYWNLFVELSKLNKKDTFKAKYYGDETGKVHVGDADLTSRIEEEVKNADFLVKSVKKSKRIRRPAAPFTTSTLQQDAANKLGFTTQRTMRVAQQLYEGIEIKDMGSVGLITYMRTDSTRVTTDVQHEARRTIETLFGSAFVPKTIPVYKSKGNAQDAHEAIRPASLELLPHKISDSLTPEQARLYKLIYDRFIASQMSPAEYDTVQVDITAGRHIFKASGSVNTFKGFLAVYEDQESTPDDSEKEDITNDYIPELSKGEPLSMRNLEKEQKFTQPPFRFTEASLVKTMEEMGIGRPSTYAPTISTIITREYVQRDKKTLVPTELGKIVDSIMRNSFEYIVDYGFTADMENKLDSIESEQLDWKMVLMDFYKDFDPTLQKAYQTQERIKVPEIQTDLLCEKCGRNMVIKSGKYGKFFACPGFPECKSTKPYIEETGKTCPKCKGNVVTKYTRTNKKYIGCEKYPDCDFSSWYMPSDEDCPKCSNFMLKTRTEGKSMLKCSNPSCGHEMEPHKKRS
ncbi:MAG: type I DNA topoisomerase [Clostridia bacterium]